MKRSIIILCAVALTRPAHADDGDPAAGFAAIVAREPGVHDTVAAAIHAAGLDVGAEARLSRRAHWAALLPTLSMRARRDLGWSDSADAIQVGNVSHGEVVEARMTWRLDRLVFDATDVRAATLAASRARERAALAAQVTALYYRRRDAELDALWRPAGDDEQTARRQLELDELTAQLDAATGGWWSARAR